MWLYWVIGNSGGFGRGRWRGVAVYYHHACRVTQPLSKYLFRYFLGDYLIFPIKWCPGIVGIGLRYLVYKMLFKRMGRNVTILEGSYLANVSQIEVGDNTSIGFECIIDGSAAIKIGSWVRMGPRVAIITTRHNFERKGHTDQTAGQFGGSDYHRRRCVDRRVTS